MNPMNPYHPDHGDEPMAEIWDAGFAAGRAAATPDPPDERRMSAPVRHRCPECFAPVNPRVLAATKEVLTLGCTQMDAAARYGVPQGSVANKIAQARAALAAADREAPDEETR